MAEVSWLFARDGDIGAKLREWSSLIGIITAIVGNILISFALNIQRYAHIRLGRDQDQNSEHWDDRLRKRHLGSYGTQQQELEEERVQINHDAPINDFNHARDGSTGSGRPRPPADSRSSSESTIKQSEKPGNSDDAKTYLSSPYWWGGILLMTVGEAGNFLAYGFAPASIVSPLGVVALVSNCIIAPCLLKERFRQRDFWGVVVAVGGAVTIVLSAKNTETKLGPHSLWSAITRWEFELYLGITAALILGLMWASGEYGDKTILIDLGLVGLFGGYTALATKGVASLLSDTLWRALTFPVTYLLVFILVLTAVLQIRYVNRALQRFDSTQVIPTQFVLFTISVIIGSAVLYRDFKSATLDQVGKFIGGCLLTFFGVYLITSGRERIGDTEDSEDDLNDEENAIGLVDEERYQDEAEIIQGDEDRSRRQSSMSVTFDEGSKHQELTRSSKQHNDCPSRPQTPQPLLSRTSTRSGPSMSESQDDQSPLDCNLWQSSDRPLGRPRPLESTMSSPLLPSEAQSGPALAHGQKRLSVPRADRPSTLSRNSLSRIAPAPLMSPLSSSLSAVVADSLRRGLNTPTSARRRPGLSSMRKPRSQRTTEEVATGMEVPGLGSSPLKSTNDHEEAGPSSGRTGQGRSSSITLGGFSG